MKTTTLLLIAALLFFFPRQSSPQQTHLVVECAVAVVVITVGAVVIYQLKTLCQKKLNGTSTNAPAPPKQSGAANFTIPEGDVTLTLTNDALSQLWDISTNGWLDASGHPYTRMLVNHAECSTNLLNWHPYLCTTSWISSASTVTVNNCMDTNKYPTLFVRACP